MAKVVLNYGPIETNCINSLETAISNLQSVVSYLQQNSIPTDFSRYSMLSNTLSDLKNQLDKLIYLKDWLIKSNRNYDSFISKLELQSSKLPVYQIKRRTSIIR